MGGLVTEQVLFAAFSTMLSQQGPADGGNRQWNLPTDLVILLNPAAPAADVVRLRHLLTSWAWKREPMDSIYAYGQPLRPWHPLVVTLTSEGDWATSAVMHLAAVHATGYTDFGTDYPGRSPTRAELRKLMQHAPGFACRLLSHVLTFSPTAPDPPPSCQGHIPRPCDDFDEVIAPAELRLTQRLGTWKCPEKRQHPLGFPRLCFQVDRDEFRLFEIENNQPRFDPLASNQDDVWVIRMPRDVMEGHSGSNVNGQARLFPPHLENLLLGLIAVTGSLSPPRPAATSGPRCEVTLSSGEMVYVPMLGESRPVIASIGPSSGLPTTCRLPERIGFTFTGPGCSGRSDSALQSECRAGDELELHAMPADLETSECARIEWRFGDGSAASGAVVRTPIRGSSRVELTVSSDDGVRKAVGWLTPDGACKERPSIPQIRYRGDSGCGERNVPCRPGETVELMVAPTTEACDTTPLQWSFGYDTAVGPTVQYTFASPGDFHVTASARNPKGTVVGSVIVPVRLPAFPFRLEYRGASSHCTPAGAPCATDERVDLYLEPSPPADAKVTWYLPEGQVVAGPRASTTMTARTIYVRVVAERSGETASEAVTIVTGPVTCPTCPSPCPECRPSTDAAAGSAICSVTHTVMSGDWLSKIALACYDDAHVWSRIFDQNRRILRHPDLIFPGQPLAVPGIDCRRTAACAPGSVDQ